MNGQIVAGVAALLLVACSTSERAAPAGTSPAAVTTNAKTTLEIGRQL